MFFKNKQLASPKSERLTNSVYDNYRTPKNGVNMEEKAEKLTKIEDEYRKSIIVVKRYLKRKKMELQYKNNKWRKK